MAKDIKSLDPYVYPNGVLKNRLGITDEGKLKQAEVDICIPRIITASARFANSPANIQTIKDVHRHIFEPIYEWAGEFRTIGIEKEEKRIIPGVTMHYTEPKLIEKELSEILRKMEDTDWKSLSLEDKSMTFTRLIAKLWRVHPFRDGNTRTTVTFASAFSRSKGFPLDLSYILPNLTKEINERGVKIYTFRDKLLLASFDEADKPEPEVLNATIYNSIRSQMRKQEAQRDDDGR